MKKFTVQYIQGVCITILALCILLDARYILTLSQKEQSNIPLTGIVRNVYRRGLRQQELIIQTNQLRYPASGSVTVRSSVTTQRSVGDIVDVRCRRLFDRENGTRYCLANTILLRAPSGAWDLRKNLFELRSFITTRFNNQIPQPASSITQAVLLGQTDELPSSLIEDFRLSGTIHLLVVSGTQILFLIQAVYWVLRALHIRRAWCTRISTVFCLVYVLMLGDSLPAFRALLLGTIPFIAYDLGRRARPFHLLLIFVTITALIQPTVLLDVGYQLSVSATIGILLFSRVWSGVVEQVTSSRSLAQLLGITLAAQAATLPIILLQFGYLPLISFAANPPISLLLSLVTTIAVSAVLLSLISVNIGSVFAAFAGSLGQWTAALTHGVAHAPYATIPSSLIAWALVSSMLVGSIILYVSQHRSHILERPL